MHIILKVLPDSNWPSVTCLMICINRNLRLISALRNGWKLISPSKSFVVYAATSTEKHQWMSHIKKCVDDLLIKRMYWQACLSGSFHQKIRNPFFCNIKVIVEGQGHHQGQCHIFLGLITMIKWNHWDGLYDIKQICFAVRGQGYPAMIRSLCSSFKLSYWIKHFLHKVKFVLPGNLLYNVLKYMYFWNRC